jgi:ribose transport system substrate-binding protein
VIIIDSPITDTSQNDGMLSTDNAAAARLAADELAKRIGGKGKIAIVAAGAGAGTVYIREMEFRDQITKNYPDIEILATQHSDGDKTKALNIATDFITANPDLVGLYANNEGSTVGAGQGVAQNGKIGKVILVGFDWSEDTKALVESGALVATMVQRPKVMGYDGLQMGYDIINGKKPATREVDTGVMVATKDNMNEL